MIIISCRQKNTLISASYFFNSKEWGFAEESRRKRLPLIKVSLKIVVREILWRSERIEI
jgi:hypothetical protein